MIDDQHRRVARRGGTPGDRVRRVSPFDPASLASFWADSTKAALEQQKAIGESFAQVLQSWLTPGGAPSSAELASSYPDLAKASQAWLDLVKAAGSLYASLAERLPAGGGVGPSACVLAKVIDPRSWMGVGSELDDVLGRMADGPRLADLWDFERRQARMAGAWVELRRRAFEHHAVLLEAWMAAGKRFSEEFAGQHSAASEPLDAKAAFTVWTEVANRQLLETQRSRPFLTTQAAMIRASIELQLAQQDIAEEFAERFGLPSRRELDDVHKTVTELRREVRALKRSLKG